MDERFRRWFYAVSQWLNRLTQSVCLLQYVIMSLKRFEEKGPDQKGEYRQTKAFAIWPLRRSNKPESVASSDPKFRTMNSACYI